MKHFFLFSILTLYLFSSCIERDMELTYLDSNGVTNKYDDDYDDNHDDNDDDDDDHHSGSRTSEWEGDFFVKSPCNKSGVYEMELKIKRESETSNKVYGKLEIENKLLSKDYVKFYFRGEITENDSKLIITTYKIKKQNIRSCNWCEINTFSFVMAEGGGLKGKWESAGCSDNGFNEDNSIILRRD